MFGTRSRFAVTVGPLATCRGGTACLAYHPRRCRPRPFVPLLQGRARAADYSDARRGHRLLSDTRGHPCALPVLGTGRRRRSGLGRTALEIRGDHPRAQRAGTARGPLPVPRSSSQPRTPHGADTPGTSPTRTATCGRWSGGRSSSTRMVPSTSPDHRARTRQSVRPTRLPCLSFVTQRSRVWRRRGAIRPSVRAGVLEYVSDIRSDECLCRACGTRRALRHAAARNHPLHRLAG